MCKSLSNPYSYVDIIQAIVSFICFPRSKPHTLAFPILVRSRKLSKYKNDSHGTKARSNFRSSFRSSTPLTSMCALYTSWCNFFSTSPSTLSIRTDCAFSFEERDDECASPFSIEDDIRRNNVSNSFNPEAGNWTEWEKGWGGKAHEASSTVFPCFSLYIAGKNRWE